MYISQALKSLHEWWRYLVGILIVLIGVGIFSIPHMIAISIKSFNGEVDMERLAQNDVAYILGLFEPNLNLVFMLLPFLGGLILLFITVKFIHKQSLISLTTSRKSIDWSRVWFSFFLWGIVSSVMIALGYLLEPENFEINFKLVPFLILLVIAILLIPIQTSFEEYLFRGYLMQGIGVITKYRWIPLLITSLVFGLMHISNPEVDKLGPVVMIYYIGTGLFLGVMTLMDEGMELALGFHAANNLFTALLVTADWTAFQTHSVLKDLSDPQNAGLTDIIIPVFVIFPILLYVFSKKYNWTSWRDKLLGSVSA
ncbi:MAG: lysostaphin resistance A-like protein [Flavobacteriaceae bacterium]